MAYSLIDTELRTNGINQRKGIVSALEKEVKKNFYKDESDALNYYRQKVERANDYDAVNKKDAKFLKEYSSAQKDRLEDVDA